MAGSTDPEELALLYVQQYLHERGHTAALAALQKSCGVLYDDDKPRRGSELMELVYLQLEQQLLGEDSSNNTTQQHEPLIWRMQEEQMLSSAAADYPNHVSASFNPSSSLSNILTVRLWPGQDLVAVGLADSSIKLLHLDGSEAWLTQLSGCGGVLTLQLHPSNLAAAAATAAAGTAVEGRRAAAGSEQWRRQHGLLLAGCMDGSVHVLAAATGQRLCSSRPHNKYVVAAVWAAAAANAADGSASCSGSSDLPPSSAAAGEEGELIATGSYDGTVCLLKLVWSGSSSSSVDQGASEAGQAGVLTAELQLLQQVSFTRYVHDVCFVQAMQPPSSRSTCYMPPPAAVAAQLAVSQQQQQPPRLQLLVAVRGMGSLSILDIPATFCSSPTGSRSNSGGSCSAVLSGLLNLSELDDGHISFSAMKMALSHCGRYLLVATDRQILVVLRLAESVAVLRRLYGLDNERFHNAALAWHRDGSYVYAGASHAAVFIYHVGSAKIVAKLMGAHTVNVRDLTYDALTNRLATGSFDKSIKVYTCG